MLSASQQAPSSKIVLIITCFNALKNVALKIKRDGKPSSRMVLLKSFDDTGFKFFTNYNSRKGQELDANPQAALCFYWDVISRQIRVEGKVKRISREESADYFSKRPLNSRISGYISDQSKVIPNKEVRYYFLLSGFIYFPLYLQNFILN